jgi:hypothetical protein
VDYAGSEKRVMARVDFDTKKLASKVNSNASKFVRKVVLDGMTQLIRQNPVDTGRSKANWGASVGSIPSEEKDTTVSNLAEQTKGISKYKLGQTMYLFNNVAYMLALEYGSSKQAARGWIRNTAEKMQKKLNEIKDLV